METSATHDAGTIRGACWWLPRCVLPLLLLLSSAATLASPSAGTPSIAKGFGTECSDSIDNDFDGLIDMDSPYCKVPEDQDEFTFGGGPDDDLNDPSSLDCFFDVNSGSGDDGCVRHACCMTDGVCPSGIDDSDFDPKACLKPPSQTCVDNCAPVAKAGCDCFGCCLVCDPSDGQCHEVFVNPVVSPSCSMDVLADPDLCKVCQRDTSCRSSGSGLPDEVFGDGFESAAARKVPGLENLTGLDALPPKGALVIALPMRIEGGSGGLVRVVAAMPGR